MYAPEDDAEPAAVHIGVTFSGDWGPAVYVNGTRYIRAED